MDTDVLLKVEHVSKRFSRSLKRALWYGVRDLTGELLGQAGGRAELRSSEFWAVDDVSFELRRGECLGLIGPNGAGKSTLLKLLNGLIKPDRGRITVRGHVGALIELGAGFNPILTGRENIYVNGIVHGISRREIDRKFDEIVDFAEIEDFLDMPVRSYSSGMRVRLGFAVATQMSPDVLMIDEVLAVGDAGFRAKCYNQISRMAERTAVVFVSHSMPQVARLANHVAVLDHGQCCFNGNAPEAINHYYQLFDVADDMCRAGSGEARIEAIRMIAGDQQEEADVIGYGQPLSIELDVVAREAIDSLVVDVTFRTIGDEAVAECNNYVRPHPIALAAGQRATIRAEIDHFTLNPGVYRIAALLMSADMTQHFDWIHNVRRITVDQGRPATTGQQFQAQWQVVSSGQTEASRTLSRKAS